MAIFLFGIERSGTTLLKMMVGSHPEIALPFSTTGMWYKYYESLKKDNFEPISDQGNLNSFVENIFNHERIKLWDQNLNIENIKKQCITGNYSSIVEAFHKEYANKAKKSIWANIDITTLNNMFLANQWFPEALFVHIVRDGRDVALSHQTMPYGSGNILECAETWNYRVSQNIKMGRMISKGRYHIIRYEDLILNTVQTLQYLCNFLKVEYSDDMVNYMAKVDSEIPNSKIWLWPELKKTPQKSRAYRWEKNMTKAQRVVFESYASSLLKELKYETYTSTPKYIPAYLLELFYFIGKGNRFKRLFGKLGFSFKSELERKAILKEKFKKKTVYTEIQKNNFNKLVDNGIYSSDFKHAKQSIEFVDYVLRNTIKVLNKKQNLRILDCGCGTGVWLSYLNNSLASSHCFLRLKGFDLSNSMLKIAKANFAGENVSVDVIVGDILNPKTYFELDKYQKGFDLIFVYDVIQQLPRNKQLEACLLLSSKLNSDGKVFIFDQDCNTIYGMKMGIKKFLTRYLGFSLVPKYYCNAKYPALNRIMGKVNKQNNLKAKIIKRNIINKRALIISKSQ